MIRNSFVLTGWLAVLLAVGIRTLHAADYGNDREEKAIRSLIAGMAEDWNRHDVKSFMSHFADDGDIVNRFGQRYEGRAKATEHLTKLHESPFRDSFVGRVSTVESVRLVTPDVAVVHEHSKEGNGGSIWTYVLSKKKEGWQVESCTAVELGSPGPPKKR